MSFNYKASITIDHTKVPNTDQTDFPILVSGVYAGAAGVPDLRTVGNGGKVQNSNGYDIQFFSDSALTTRIPAERERYNASTGELVVWIKKTVLTGTDVVIYIGYGDASISTDPNSDGTYGATSVWDSNYKGVYHLKDGTTLSVLSSTGANNGTNNGATAAAGKINGGLAATNQTINVDLGTGINVSGSFTLSAWVNLTANTFVNYVRGIVSKGLYGGDGNGDASLALARMGNILGAVGTGRFLGTVFTSSGRYDAEDTISAPTGAWYYLVVTWDGSNLKLYKNGVLITTTATAGTVTNASTKNFYLAGYPGVSAILTGLNGAEDEARISTGIARSIDRIVTEYNNQDSPSTFYTMGAETATGTAYTSTLTEVVTGTATVIKSLSRTLSDVVTITDIILKNLAHVFSEVVSLLATFLSSFLRSATFTETITLTDVIARLEQRIFSEVLTLTDTFEALRVKLLTEVITLTDTLTRVINRTFTEIITLIDNVIVPRIFTEIVVLTDTLLKLAQRIFTETVVLTDTLVKMAQAVFLEIIYLEDELIMSLNGIVTNLWAKVARTIDTWTKIEREED